MDTEEFLAHYGVKGMKWGVRKDRPGGVSRRVDREARKDAKEAARAKSFYGEGAGTRRKLSKQTVEGKSKRIPGYKEAFDYHLNNQDSSKHASKAVSERKRKDVAKKTKQTAGAVARSRTGEMGTQAAFTVLALGGAAYLTSGKGQAHLNRATSFIRSGVNSQRQRRGAQHIADWLQNNS